jgi:hypothetical protein
MCLLCGCQLVPTSRSQLINDHTVEVREYNSRFVDGQAKIRTQEIPLIEVAKVAMNRE